MSGRRQGQGLDQEWDMGALWAQIQTWAAEAGFSQIGVADVDLRSAEPGLLAWLQAGYAGEMDYMSRHGLRRMRPAELVPGTLRVITARMDYLPAQAQAHAGSVGDADEGHGGGSSSNSSADWRAVEEARLQQPDLATISLYARGRDYHKVLRSRLQKLADRITQAIGPFGHRVFTDSAPVAEVELAQRSGVGWRGKHTLLLHREAGSMFFLGEIFVTLPLPLTP